MPSMEIDKRLSAASALELRDRLASGALRAEELAEALIARYQEVEPEVQAFTWFDADFFRAQARDRDNQRKLGRAIGPLHGLPVAIKDVIDTETIPTENGTILNQGRVPRNDAALIKRLKQAGAIIMGKTVTAELAYLHPGKTRNPVNKEHTPGGSSSGSAAAVASGMVPLAIGTQTGGSVIRPASYCGTIGFKPTFGAIPRTGVLNQSQSLDTIGVFARSVADASLLAETLYGHDAADPATTLRPHPQLLATAQSKPPLKPIFAFVKSPYWDQADASTREAFEELFALLGKQAFEAPLASVFAEAAKFRETINFAEMARNYGHYQRKDATQLSPILNEVMAKGEKILAHDYLAALDWRDVYNTSLNEIFDHCDCIITPAAPGPAPHSLASTGSSIFNAIWTLCGTPAISIPAFNDENGLPMGVQLVGKVGEDARLMRSAQWLCEFIEQAQQENS